MVVEDGTPGHVLAMCSAPAPGLRLSPPRRLYSWLVTQTTFSRSWALFEDGNAASPFCLMGMAPLDDGSVEAWFIVRPGGLAGWLLLALVRFARARLDEAACPAICLVLDGNRSGERLVRSVGFQLSDERFGNARVWRRPNESGCETIRGGHGRAETCASSAEG